MYINKIDDLIDRIIDDLYTVIVLKNKKFEKLKDETNFTKSQKEINEMILDYIKTIPPSEITNIVKKGDSYTNIFDTLQRYIVIYVFLTIGIFYKGKPDVFINNMIEFSRNQSEHPLKIDNFFNSESNSLIIKLFYMCKNILLLLSKDTIKIDHIRKEPYAAETMEFLSNLSDEFIDMGFRLNEDGDVESQAHNIIKTIIVLLVYKINDKKILYAMIEQTELSEGEYMFIDIIEPITETINFATIESLLSKKDLFDGLAYDIWDYMEEVDAAGKKIVTNEQKINILINAGIIIPILDDFLLYHRDNERYDKITTSQGVKKKEDTKVRYIIGKIDTTTELYSDAAKKDPSLKANIMKNFSVPFYNRKAILRNNVEDIKIINKFINQGKRNTENNDYFNDLVFYRRYSYVNFKDFEKNGFSNHFTKTITACRAVNFDTTSEFKQNNIYNRLQLRVGAKDSIGNIVGFVIPSNVRALQCIKIADVVNIRSLSKKNKNGFDLFVNFLKRSVIKNQLHKSSVYWIFDLDQDKVKIDKIETKDTMTQQDMVKAMATELYNRVVREVYYEIIDKIDIQTNITLEGATRIINYLQMKILKIPLSQDIYEDLERYIFEKKFSNIRNEEILENDILYGLEGPTIKLPLYIFKEEKIKSKLTIDLSHVDESGKIIEVESVDGICQHNVTWESMAKVREANYSEYMRLLYNFIQQYVIENTQQEFICKSCGFYLDIKKYIQDGVFDDEKGYITFSMPMETNLEDIPEYEKYQFSIKIMEKNIEKIASSVGISFFVGNTVTVKWRRKAIIKNTIDMVTQNNQLLSKGFKERNENKTRMYGISKSLSTLFVFDMENNIFQTSTKDKDQEQYKLIKRNNIMTYIMIFLILELNESQISFFVSDKKNMCDIRIFDKVYGGLFGGLKIKKNNTTDTVDIVKYKILCYMIYMISARIAKHKLWYSPQTSEKNIQKMIPIVQRFIIHTSVDIINSILENSFTKGVSYIFEVFRVRFYSKLNSIFKDDDYYNLLLEQSNFSYVTARKRGHLKTIQSDMLPDFIYNNAKWRTMIPMRYFPKYLDKVDIQLYGISNLSNCPSGVFHVWNVDGTHFVCKLCGAKMNELVKNATETEKVIDKFKIARMNLLAQKFCQVDGELHQYVFDPVTKQNICIKCKKSSEHIYSVEELEKVAIMIDSLNERRRNKYISTVNDYTESDNAETTYIQQVVERNLENIKKDFNKEKPLKYIDSFIDMVQSSIGNEVKGDYPIQLRNNTYIIDHDHNGNDLGGKEIIITEADNKIFYKTNHPHFKTDVMFYTDKSVARVDVFYDAVTRTLLGYKEASRDFVDINKTDKKIKVNYSVYNKIKLLGYSGKFINIDENYRDIKEELIGAQSHRAMVQAKIEEHEKYELKKTEQKMSRATHAHQDKQNNGIDKNNKVIDEGEDKLQELYKYIVKDVCGIRLDNLKRTILEFQRIFNRILNGYVAPSFDRDQDKGFAFDKEGEPQKASNFERENPNFFAERMNALVDKYKKKLKNIVVSEKSGKHAVFKHWKGITRGIFVDDFSDKYFNFDSNLIESENISKFDSQSNQVLFYMIHEFTSLLQLNTDGYVKSNICNFLVEFIDRVFFRYNTENLYVNNEIKRFMFILESEGYLKENEEVVKSETQGFYEEYVDIEEENPEEAAEAQLDLEEEQDAIDVEDADVMEDGVESKFDRLMEWEDSHGGWVD